MAEREIDDEIIIAITHYYRLKHAKQRQHSRRYYIDPSYAIHALGTLYRSCYDRTAIGFDSVSVWIYKIFCALTYVEP